ncbi:hypothetical protein BH11MYX4_BH11MYX4_35560 [soil metagenome]
MWNMDSGANGTNGSYGSHAYDFPEAQAATAPHPATVITGDGPSRHFFDTASGAWKDHELTRLGDLDPGDAAFLQQRGLIVTPAGTPPTATFRIRLQGRLVVPRDLAKRPSAVPIVFIVMGNHRAFEVTSGGVKEHPNFAGYDYLQQALADVGVASCSVDTNYANALDLGIRARAEMLLDTVALVRSKAPPATVAKLDFATRFGLVGHSRGGDAVVMAALLAAARGLPFKVGCVASIAPTDNSGATTGFIDAGAGQRVRVPTSLGAATRYLVLLGAHDGDVAGPSGNGFGLYDRATGDKTLIFARGITHNRFNTVWNECADYADGRHIFVDDDDCRRRPSGATFDPHIFAAVVHREYAKFAIGALVRRALLGDAAAEDVLRGLVAPTRTLLQQTPSEAGPAASIQWSVTSALTVDEFDAKGVGARTPTGGAVVAANEGRPTVPHASASFVAKAAGDKVRIELGGRDLSARRELTLRLTSMIPVKSEAAIKAAHAPDWVIRLVTSRGVATCTAAELDRRGLRDPNRPFFCEVYPFRDGNAATQPAPFNVTKNQYDTLALPLSAFANADLRDVRAIEFEARGGALPLIVDSFAFV